MAIASAAASASVSSTVITAPWVGSWSITGWPASDSLWIDARRYHEERCQKRLAAASASAWVASSRSAVAAQGGSGWLPVPTSFGMFARLNASVTGQSAFEPNPSASRW